MMILNKNCVRLVLRPGGIRVFRSLPLGRLQQEHSGVECSVSSSTTSGRGSRLFSTATQDAGAPSKTLLASWETTLTPASSSSSSPPRTGTNGRDSGKFSVEIHAAPCMFDHTFLTSVIARGTTSSSRSGSSREPSDGRNAKLFLLNPANEGLCGIQYPTFPRNGYGSPVPFRIPEISFNWCRAEGQIQDYQTLVATMHGGGGDRANGSAGEVSANASESGKRHTAMSPPATYKPAECVDGMVHRLCGPDLLTYLTTEYHRRKDFSVLLNTQREPTPAIRCPPGESRWSPAFGALKPYFPDGILHAVSPFRNFDYSELNESSSSETAPLTAAKLLRQTYLDALRQALSRASGNEIFGHKVATVSRPAGDSTEATIASPLLGTGVRGFAIAEGARIAARACVEFSKEMTDAKDFATTSTSEDNNFVDPQTDTIKNADYLQKKDGAGTLDYDRDDWFSTTTRVPGFSYLSSRHDEPDLYQKILASKKVGQQQAPGAGRNHDSSGRKAKGQTDEAKNAPGGVSEFKVVFVLQESLSPADQAHVVAAFEEARQNDGGTDVSRLRRTF
ncbi:unnamed protein product [Amoebophrya sp. A120]|nr:unnamed protein product [Amoebophrya sp. A120]|eukprot:GSA120T00003155001.1